MLDVTLFRDRRFSAASGAVTVTFFALFGFIFLITQYFQFVRDYGATFHRRPYPAGRGEHRGRLRRRGLPGAAHRHQGRRDHGSGALRLGVPVDLDRAADTSYASVIVPQMVMMGLGMGLISTPATESILLVLPPARAGVGSAVNDATRELGGTLGVAVVGSIFSSVYAADLADGLLARLPGAAFAEAEESVGAGAALAASADLSAAFESAFLAGLEVSCIVVGMHLPRRSGRRRCRAPGTGPR